MLIMLITHGGLRVNNVFLLQYILSYLNPDCLDDVDDS